MKCASVNMLLFSMYFGCFFFLFLSTSQTYIKLLFMYFDFFFFFPIYTYQTENCCCFSGAQLIHLQTHPDVLGIKMMNTTFVRELLFTSHNRFLPKQPLFDLKNPFLPKEPLYIAESCTFPETRINGTKYFIIGGGGGSRLHGSMKFT